MEKKCTSQKTENVNVVEKANSIKEISDICKKYNIMFIPGQATITFSRIAEELYKKHPSNNYAVCGSENTVELVSYSKENKLIQYCKGNKLHFLSIVNEDGSGKVFNLETMITP